MGTIRRAGLQDVQLLSMLGSKTFVESHGHSASEEIIQNYVNSRYKTEHFRCELEDELNIYSIIYFENEPAGYSKIIFNTPYEKGGESKVTKLELIYILKEYYDLGLGKQLLQYNDELARKLGQKGIWLNVWTENHRAINFYTKYGFRNIGSYYFKLSEQHSNPNHVMSLEF